MPGRSPVDLKSVAQVTTDNRRKTNCDARRTRVLRAIKTGSPSAAKAAEQTSQPRDRRNTGRRKFSGRLWPYLKPERVRDNKEQRIGGRPVEIRQQASSFGHSQKDVARRLPA